MGKKVQEKLKLFWSYMLAFAVTFIGVILTTLTNQFWNTAMIALLFCCSLVIFSGIGFAKTQNNRHTLILAITVIASVISFGSIFIRYDPSKLIIIYDLRNNTLAPTDSRVVTINPLRQRIVSMQNNIIIPGEKGGIYRLVQFENNNIQCGIFYGGNVHMTDDAIIKNVLNQDVGVGIIMVKPEIDYSQIDMIVKKAVVDAVNTKIFCEFKDPAWLNKTISQKATAYFEGEEVEVKIRLDEINLQVNY